MIYDPNATAIRTNGIFGFPFNEENSKLVIIPVPWDVTTSYGQGTAQGPEAVLVASSQLDVCDPIFGDFYKQGIFLQSIPEEWVLINQQNRNLAKLIQQKLADGRPLDSDDDKAQRNIDRTCEKLNHWVYSNARELLAKDKIPAVLGGDHSCPLGLMQALSEHYQEFSILHIDAHHDLRSSYQGFKYSHASIMRNAVETCNIQSLVQIGIRDFCPAERDYARMNHQIRPFYDAETHLAMARGKTWYEMSRKIIDGLGDHVYVSFDIDGLSPDHCPHTGTPVPGGLSFNDISTLFYCLKESRKKIIGFDLCEVSPGEQLDGWDGNVGARILYKLCGIALS